MSIEKLLQEHIEALNANTAALEALVKQGGGATSSKKTEKTEESTGKTSKAGKSDKSSKSAAPTQDEMTAALLKLKDDYGIEHAKKIMKKHGFVKMAEITEDKYAAVLKDAVKAHEALESAGDGEGDDEGDM